MEGEQRPSGRLPKWKRYRRPKSQNENNEGQNENDGERASSGNQDKDKEKSAVKAKMVKIPVKKDVVTLPPPSLQQLDALTDLIVSVNTQHGMTKQDIFNRKRVLENLHQTICKGETQDVPLRLCGSSLSSLGLKTSNVNIDIYNVKEEETPRIFIRFLDILKNNENYLNVKEDFHSSIPEINFIDIRSGLKCRLTTENQTTFLTSNLLKIYGALDERVKPLCVAFKLWAKICKVDNPGWGTLPPYCFILMVVHFLQQTDPPVLPVLHEMFNEGGTIKEMVETPNVDEEIAKILNRWGTKNTECLGALWLALLRYYADAEYIQGIIINVKCKGCPRSSRKWGKRYFAIEDPFSTKRNVARNATKNSFFQYIMKHLKIALQYFGNSPSTTVDQLSQVTNKSSGSNDASGGGTPSCVAGNKAEHSGRVISSSDSGKCSDVDHHEVIEAGSDDDGNVVDNDDDLDNDKDDDEDDDDDDKDLVDGVFAMDNINDSAVSDSDDSTDNVTNRPKDTATCVSKRKGSNTSMIVETGSNSSMIVETGSNSSLTLDKRSNISMSVETTATVYDSCMEYCFDDSVLRKGPALEMSCRMCGEQDHIDENCEEDEKVVLKKLPKLTGWFKNILNDVCVCCAKDFGITNEEVGVRRYFMRALEVYIQKEFPDAKLHLFGSSCNGFGFNKSDLDICMMFDKKRKSDVDCIAVITSLKKLLYKNPECGDVLAITGAKVPIVKFFLKRPKLEADISLYNEVALSNTKLLATYVNIDQRVRVLGCTLKVFVKLCDIGDASRGSLSSYAYILMLIYFLQQREPPVLPVLQELHNGEEMPTVMVDGHNCWFYDDLNNLSSRWQAKNTESCGELWLGFLRYFTEVFDFSRHVVCIRSSKPLTKFEKMWNGKKICIEDPFVLSHNLGVGLSLNMAKFILSTLVKAREWFGTPRQNIPDGGQPRQRFFFDPVVLNGGYLPPTDRNCSICGKIGHMARRCPYNKKNNRENQNQQRKNQKNKEDVKKDVLEEVDGKNAPTAPNVRPPAVPDAPTAPNVRPPAVPDAPTAPNVCPPTVPDAPTAPNVRPPAVPDAPTAPNVRPPTVPDAPTAPNVCPPTVPDAPTAPNVRPTKNNVLPLPTTSNIRPVSPVASMMRQQPALPVNHRMQPLQAVRASPPYVMYPSNRPPLAARFPQSPNLQSFARPPSSDLGSPGAGVRVQGLPPPPPGFAGGFLLSPSHFGQQFGGSSPQQQAMMTGLPQRPALPPTRYAEITPVPLMAMGGLRNSPPNIPLPTTNSLPVTNSLPGSSSLPGMSTSPRIITCEALEKQGRDQTDAFQGGIPEHTAGQNPGGFSPSVIHRLRSLSLNDPDDVRATGSCHHNQGSVDHTPKLDQQLFATPPNVQNVAAKSLYHNFEEFASSVTSNQSPLSELTPDQNDDDQLRDEESDVKTAGNEHENGEEGVNLSRKGESPGEQTPSKRNRRRRNRGRKRNKEAIGELSQNVVAEGGTEGNHDGLPHEVYVTENTDITAGEIATASVKNTAAVQMKGQAAATSANNASHVKAHNPIAATTPKNNPHMRGRNRSPAIYASYTPQVKGSVSSSKHPAQLRDQTSAPITGGKNTQQMKGQEKAEVNQEQIRGIDERPASSRRKYKKPWAERRGDNDRKKAVEDHESGQGKNNFPRGGKTQKRNMKSGFSKNEARTSDGGRQHAAGNNLVGKQGKGATTHKSGPVGQVEDGSRSSESKQMTNQQQTASNLTVQLDGQRNRAVHLETPTERS